MRKIVDVIDKIEPGQVVLYLDKYGIMHATKSRDNAMNNAVGKMMITDEVGNDHGKPVINGVSVEVYGAGEGYVYLSKYAKEHDYRWLTAEETYKVPAGGSVSVSHKDLTNAEKKAYRMANEYYLELL